MTSVSEILSNPLFKRAMAFLEQDHDRFVEDIVHLTEIPSPPFGEEMRAREYANMLSDSGMDDVLFDEIGNVTALMKGKGQGGIVAVAAHMDTVFPAGTDVQVRREGTKLFAPGIGDDTRGLAVLLTLIRAINASDIQPEKDILFVGNVGEEGRGDLRGMRYLFTQGEYKDRVDAFFSIDGSDTSRLVTGAVGSKRYRVTFSGPGGHSYGAFGTVSPSWPLGDFLAGMARIDVPETPKTTYSASVIAGGSSINAIPEALWVDIDLRSVDPAELDKLDQQIHQLAEAAVAAENSRNNTANGEIAVHFEQVGNRPAGHTSHENAIVVGALEAINAFGFEARTEYSSTDANIPISLGIPAVTFGNGGTSDRAHTLEEWIDVEPELSLRGLYAALAAILATAGMVE